MPTDTLFIIGSLLLVAILTPCFADAQNSPPPGAAAPPASLGPPTKLRCEYLVNPLGIDRTTPRLSWRMVDGRRGARQTAYQILAGDSLEQLAADQGNVWDTGKVASDQSIQVAYAGMPLKSRQRVWWKVRVWDHAGQPSPWSEPAFWTMGLLERADWGAKWIGDPTPPPSLTPPQPPPAPLTTAASQPDTKPARPQLDPLPATMLRKEFTTPADAPIRRATAYCTALGAYELRMNGQRVGDHILAPEWTDYHQRVQYQAYDVTPLLRRGENAIGAILGDGWYAGRIGLAGIVPGGPLRGIYGRQPKLLLRLEIEGADGQVQVVMSDGSWRCTNEGPIRVSDILDGETYDARREITGWDEPGFDDADDPTWQDVAALGLNEIKHPRTRKPVELVAQPNEPIRVVKELKPVALTEPQPGVYVYDLGQNIVGWCRFRLRAPAGATVKLRHAEVLNPDGTLYTANLRSAAQTDMYTCRGPATARTGETAADRDAHLLAAYTGGVSKPDDEVSEPHFTYHGFRYVEVTGLPYKPALADLTGRVFHSAAPDAGHFECSEPLVNKLWQNAVWTQRANLMSSPTDCPQRDERLGWMGDILAFAQAGCFNMDMAAFFTKWIPDVRDAQAEDGRYPDFAPHPFGKDERFTGVPAWGDAGVFVPWTAYVNYADHRLLEEHFDSARRWVDWIRANNPDLLWKNKRHNDYGDWLNADTLKLDAAVTGGAPWPKGAEVPKEIFGTMFFARSADLVARMAGVLGKTAEQQQYARLFEDIKTAFNKAYVAPDGRMQGNTQAGYAIALHFGLLPSSEPRPSGGGGDRSEARPRPDQPPQAAYMLEAFDTYHGCLTTGFHSTICLMRELSARGLNDHAYRLLLNRRMPSWLYPVEHGATTIWERWDGYVEGRGFQDPGMNSFAHYAFGCVGEWLFGDVAGINPDEANPGYKHIIIRPQPGPGLTWAAAEYDSIHGRIASRWELPDKRANTAAAPALVLQITIPPNTTATVYVPARPDAPVMENGKPADQAEGVQPLRREHDAAVYRVGAGRYRFTVSPPRQNGPASR
ncbi:MAG: glycoside hydrolase family 78 protein [Planctomycetota bacterium]